MSAAYDRDRVVKMSQEDVWWEQETPSRQKRPQRRAQTLPPMTRIESQKQKAQRRKAQMLSRFLMYAMLGVVTVCLVVQVNRYAFISAQTKQISSLVNQIKTLENDQVNLQLRLSARENLKQIRDEAMYNLGMDYPRDDQVRVVALNTSSAQIPAQTAAIPAEITP